MLEGVPIALGNPATGTVHSADATITKRASLVRIAQARPGSEFRNGRAADSSSGVAPTSCSIATVSSGLLIGQMQNASNAPNTESSVGPATATVVTTADAKLKLAPRGRRVLWRSLLLCRSF